MRCRYKVFYLLQVLQGHSTITTQRSLTLWGSISCLCSEVDTKDVYLHNYCIHLCLLFAIVEGARCARAGPECRLYERNNEIHSDNICIVCSNGDNKKKHLL